MIAKAALVASLAMALASPGCGSKPEGSVVYRLKGNDFELEYDGRQKTTTIGPGLLQMSRLPEDISISQGVLRVGDREYGAIARHDKISVVAGTVAVNGRVRTPTPADAP